MSEGPEMPYRFSLLTRKRNTKEFRSYGEVSYNKANPMGFFGWGSVCK